MSSFDGLYIGLSGLRSHQLVQEMSSHNVANANTPGYSRCQAVLASLPPTGEFSPALAGSGVAVSTIRRSVSNLLNQQVRQENGLLGQWETLRNGTDEVQQLFHEPGPDGLQAAMDDFWQSWRDLSVDPTSMAARSAVVQAGDRLAIGFRTASKGLADFVMRMDDQLQGQVDQLNTLTAEIAGVNKQIVAALANKAIPNDLRDRRDTLLDQLSKITQVKTGENNDGSITITLGGRILVGQSGAVPIATERDASGQLQAVWGDDRSAVAVGAGQMAATRTLQGWAQNDAQAALDQIAGQIIASVNNLVTAGVLDPATMTPGPTYDLNGDTGVAFFTGADAASMGVSTAVADHPDRIAVATSPAAPGDGGLALAIAGLAAKTLPALNDSIGGAYATLVGDVALNAQKSEQMTAQEQSLLEFLQGRQQDIGGVSLDEEAIQMMGAQRAYQAAARVITAVDEMLDKLINETGLVGR